MGDPESRPQLAALPRTDALVSAADELVSRFGRRAVTDALRRTLDDARQRMLAGHPVASDAVSLIATAAADLSRRLPGPPVPVINAAGVVIHTNLGRAPLSEDATQAVVAAAGYCDLEYDLGSGGRGHREARADGLLVELTGAEAGMAVNNAAAALVLALTALADGRQVLVSRGELVEIGGSFRLPDIMAVSGARLVEVGTTNRTRIEDYDGGEDVAAILKVHPSNYRVTGFVASPSVEALAATASARGVPLVHDIGSGLISSQTWPPFADEPSITGSLGAGTDLAICSGDKLLGGPQAGIIVGRRALVERCRRHPLARALRLDKLRIAALVATLDAHLRDGREALPVWRMLATGPALLRGRADELARRVGGSVEEAVTLIGGGAAPEAGVPSPVVRIGCANPAAAAALLRTGDPPIVVRVEHAALWVDLRTVPPDSDDLVAARLARAVDTTST